MSSPTKRLAVFFDGTDNTPKDLTNVWRMHELLAEKDAAGIPQQKRYIVGVGTELGTLVTGSAFGASISRKIREGYEWLVENYTDGAEIYVVGFSRGAFAARSLVQMVATCGLVRPETLGRMTVESVFARYRDISQQQTEVVRPIWRLRYWNDKPEDKPAGWTPTADDELFADQSKVRLVKIRMAGLWDTVGSLGLDGFAQDGASIEKFAAHNVRPTKAQEYGYQAMAINEHRALFEITRWRTFFEDGEAAQQKTDYYAQHYEQRWFIGAHSDVGGGYHDDDLPDITLSWMMAKAVALGLAFTRMVVPKDDAWKGKIHDSFQAFAGGVLTIWDKVLPGDQRHYRDIGDEPRRVVTAHGENGEMRCINETIDESVFKRWAGDATYRPPGLVSYFRRHRDKLPEGIKAESFRFQQSKEIEARQYWNATGVNLVPGVRYRARVLPALSKLPLKDASFETNSIAGEDWNSLAHRAVSLTHGKRRDDAKWFALIGTVDQHHSWLMTDGGEFTVPVSGQLVCYFNDVQLDVFYGNNSGSVVLEVEQLD